MFIATPNQIFTATIAGRIIGVALLIPTYTFLGRKDRLEYIVVDEPYRERGIGRELVRMVIAASERAGALGLYLESMPTRPAARAVYLKAGFTVSNTNLLYIEHTAPR